MGTSTRALLQLWIILCSIAVVLCILSGLSSHREGALLSVVPALLIIPPAWLLTRDSRRKDTVPDHLSRRCNEFFERSGLCFTGALETVEGTAFLAIYFQNRYAGACEAVLRFRPGASNRIFSFWRFPLPKVEVKINCPAGGFGVARVPYAAPAKLRGKQVVIEPSASVRYVNGRGEALRVRRGIPVGDARGFGNVGWTLMQLLGGLGGHLHTRRAASMHTIIPRTMPEIPAAGEPQVTILDIPQLPGGSPVLPASPPAVTPPSPATTAQPPSPSLPTD